MRRAMVLGVLVGAAAVAAQEAPAPPGTPTEIPAALRPAVERAEQAIGALQRRLQTRLVEALAAGGPPAAIRVCKAEAPALATQVGAEFGVEVGRTSLRLRNPQNAPRPWARPLVAAAAGRPAAAVGPQVVELGEGRVGVLRPIPMQPLCGGCHGPREQLDPEVRAALAAAYPADQAVGFREGDLRGFFWAEARVP